MVLVIKFVRDVIAVYILGDVISISVSDRNMEIMCNLCFGFFSVCNCLDWSKFSFRCAKWRIPRCPLTCVGTKVCCLWSRIVMGCRESLTNKCNISLRISFIHTC